MINVCCQDRYRIRTTCDGSLYLYALTYAFTLASPFQIPHLMDGSACILVN